MVTEPLSHACFQRWFDSSIFLGLFHLLLNNSVFCRLYGWMQARSGSRRKISRFARQYAINVEELEYPQDRYPSFNAFFTRRLKPDARPFDLATDTFSCPADGKVLVYQQLVDGARIPVKGASVPLQLLLDSEDEARYRPGSVDRGQEKGYFLPRRFGAGRSARALRLSPVPLSGFRKDRTSARRRRAVLYCQSVGPCQGARRILAEQTRDYRICFTAFRTNRVPRDWRVCRRKHRSDLQTRIGRQGTGEGVFSVRRVHAGIAVRAGYDRV